MAHCTDVQLWRPGHCQHYISKTAPCAPCNEQLKANMMKRISIWSVTWEIEEPWMVLSQTPNAIASRPLAVDSIDTRCSPDVAASPPVGDWGAGLVGFLPHVDDMLWRLEHPPWIYMNRTLVDPPTEELDVVRYEGGGQFIAVSEAEEIVRHCTGSQTSRSARSCV